MIASFLAGEDLSDITFSSDMEAFQQDLAKGFGMPLSIDTSIADVTGLHGLIHKNFAEDNVFGGYGKHRDDIALIPLSAAPFPDESPLWPYFTVTLGSEAS